MREFIEKTELKKWKKFVTKVEKKKFVKLSALEAVLVKQILSNGFIVDLFEKQTKNIKEYLRTHKAGPFVLSKSLFNLEDFYSPEKNLFDCSYEKLL